MEGRLSYGLQCYLPPDTRKAGTQLRDGRLSYLGRWLHTQIVTHPSINQDQRRATRLIMTNLLSAHSSAIYSFCFDYVH